MKNLLILIIFSQIAYAQLKELTIPPRLASAKTGSQFMQYVMNMSFSARENEIYKEISTGNIPNFLRQLITIDTTFKDLNGTSHTVKYQVMPDYLAIGSDSNFCRIPMGPITAQKLCNLFGAVMPTRKLVDAIYKKAQIKLAPFPYAPIGNQNELVPKFIAHNAKIEEQRLTAGGLLGQLTGGTKKDVVLSNKIIDPNRPNHVCIYGWHQLSGVPIQPLTNIHINTYVDYSHGVRLLNNEVLIDGEIKLITDILKDNILYKIFSDEVGVMSQPTYIKPTGVEVEGTEEMGYNLLQNYPNPFNPDTNIQYHVPENSRVTIKVYDILGNKIQELVNDEQQQGSYIVKFNALEYSNGVYIYRMTAGKFSISKKMILLK